MFGLSLTNLKAGLFKGGSRPLAIDFGTTALRALLLSDAEVPTILAAAALATPDTLLGDPAKRFAFQLEQLPGFIKSNKLCGHRAVVSIPAFATFCRHMQVPTMDERETSSYIASMVAGELNCDPAMLLCRPMPVEGANPGGAVGAGKSEVIALATPVGVIERIMDAMRAARLTPVGIHPEALAMVRSFDHMTARAGDVGMTSLYVDIGYGTTKVAMAHGRDLVFVKTIELGGRYLDQHVAATARATMAEAHAARLKMEIVSKDEPARTPGNASPTGSAMPHLDAAVKHAQMRAAAMTAEERRIGAAPVGAREAAGTAEIPADLAEPLSVLTDEIAHCMRYHESMFPGNKIGRTIFVGGEARHAGLCQHVARRLRVAAHMADPLARFARSPKVVCSGVELTKQQPGWCVAAGLAVGPTDL